MLETDLHPNPLLFRRKSIILRENSPQILIRQETSEIGYKVVVDQSPLKNMTPEEDLLGIGYSFGFTGFNNETQKASGTIRVETKQCLMAYLSPGNLYIVMKKHRLKKEEKMLQIVRQLPYFKGVTRNTAVKIAGFLEKHKPCINQVLIK